MSKDFNSNIDLIKFQPAEFLAFRDMEVCKRVAKIKKDDITKPPKNAHPNFKI